MFRNAVRRLLWLGPTLLLVTIPTFWAVTRSTDHFAPTPDARLPLFLNLHPVDVRVQAEQAARVVASDGDAVAAAALVRFGGAALPHVLPLFDSLPPDARVRLALALAPIAMRMGIGSAGELGSPDTAVLFWSHYWEEHSIDFRPAAVSRSVRRFAERPSPLRRTEVLELDTFALESLVASMQPPKTPEDVRRMRALVEAAAHVTGAPADGSLTIPEGASPAAARRVVEQWRLYWVRHRSDHMAFTGTKRLGATLRETRYVQFLEQLQRQGFGTTRQGDPVASLLWSRGRITLFLLLSALLAGYPLAAFIGLSRAAGHAAWNLGPLAASLAVATLTPVGLSGILLRGVRATPSIGLAGIVMALACAAIAMRHARSLHDRAGELVHVRTSIAFGASRLHAALLAAKGSVPALLALAVSDLPTLTTTAFVTERAFSLRGLGDVTTEALRAGDLTWLMAVALLGTFLLGVAQIAADVVSELLDPRREPVRARRGRT